MLRLQQYEYEVMYCPGSMNIADSLSRLTVLENDQQKRNVAEEYIRFVAEQSTPCVISVQQLEKESSQDPVLQQIRQAIETGDWSDCSKSVKAVRDEITKVGQLVLRDTQIIPPVSLHQKLIHAAHEGHQGIVKTKARLRSKLWWPEMDKMTEAVCKSCFECQLVSQPTHPEPMSRTPLPNEPWEHLAADLLGPLPNGQYVFVVITANVKAKVMGMGKFRPPGAPKPLNGFRRNLEYITIIIIIIQKFITRTCSQALSMNRRRGQSLGGLTVCINC